MKKLSWIALVLLLSFTTTLEAKKKKPRFKPYTLASTEAGEVMAVIDSTREAIKGSKFSLVGEYSPYDNAQIFILTHDKLLDAASKSEFGGYGAVIRVAVTGTDAGVQVSYVNPVYMTNLYHIPEVPDVIADLEATFGAGETFGSKKGKSKRSLKNFQYMMFMPEFEDHDKLGKFDSHEKAVAAVNANLASGSFKLSKVFEVAIPGTEEVLIGVGIGEGKGADGSVMPLIDKSAIKHTAHLPYAVLISGKTVYAQAGKFRIASSFPDLSMGQFMDISDAPDAIKKTLKQLAK